jgi:transposase InsO family protein
MNPNDFSQLRLLFTDPIQHDYEAIRPVVLFAEPVTQRSAETEMGRTTLSDKARRFVTEGMFGLADKRAAHSGRKRKGYPEAVVRYILQIKQLYPPITNSEIVRILSKKFGYSTTHHTVRKFLEKNPIPIQLELKIETFHEFEDNFLARWTVVRMYHEGWKKKSISNLLKISRPHLDTLLAKFEEKGFEGLEDKRTRPPNHPHNQLVMPFLDEVFEVQQEYPGLGRRLLFGVLESRLGEENTPSKGSVGRAMAANRFFRNAPNPYQKKKKQKKEKKPLPYNPLYPHQYWFIDIRYLAKLDGKWVYSICLMEGYSRTILAGMTSLYQDEIAILQLLHAALAQYGRPEAIVSDNAGVFKADAYKGLLKKLVINRCRIEKRQSWQNLIETQFNIQRLYLDMKLENADSLEQIQTEHAKFIHLFNTTRHGAHEKRVDGRRSPMAVLGGAMGRPIAGNDLENAFRHLQFVRVVNQNGLVSVQRFYIYAERGLANQRVSIWIHQGKLHVEHQKTLLAQYACQLNRKSRTLTSVTEPQLYQTPFASAQLELFELDETQWQKIYHRPPYKHHPKGGPMAEQLPLFGLFCLLFFW